jgi:hypothetical protein
VELRLMDRFRLIPVAVATAATRLLGRSKIELPTELHDTSLGYLAKQALTEHAYLTQLRAQDFNNAVNGAMSITMDLSDFQTQIKDSLFEEPVNDQQRLFNLAIEDLASIRFSQKHRHVGRRVLDTVNLQKFQRAFAFLSFLRPDITDSNNPFRDKFSSDNFGIVDRFMIGMGDGIGDRLGEMRAVV